MRLSCCGRKKGPHPEPARSAESKDAPRLCKGVCALSQSSTAALREDLQSLLDGFIARGIVGASLAVAGTSDTPMLLVAGLALTHFAPRRCSARSRTSGSRGRQQHGYAYLALISITRGQRVSPGLEGRPVAEGGEMWRTGGTLAYSDDLQDSSAVFPMTGAPCPAPEIRRRISGISGPLNLRFSCDSESEARRANFGIITRGRGRHDRHRGRPRALPRRGHRRQAASARPHRGHGGEPPTRHECHAGHAAPRSRRSEERRVGKECRSRWW